MKSFEVIRQAVDEPGVKAVAAALKVSPALVYKWCEPPAEADDPDQSGAKNVTSRQCCRAFLSQFAGYTPV